MPSQVFDELRSVRRRRRRVRIAERDVGVGADEVGEIDSHEDDEAAGLAEAIGECGGTGDDIGGGVWGDGASDDGLLQVDENDGGRECV